MVADVDGGDEQTAIEHVGLNKHTKLAADMPGVDGLDGRLIVRRQLHEVHDLRPVEQFPPVEVGPVVGGKAVGEQGVRGVDIGTGGVGRPHLEPRGVPKHGEVVLHDIAAQTDAARRGEQHLAAALQHLEGTGIEGVRQINVGHLGNFFLGGVYPEVPMVADIGTERDGEGELARGLNATKGEADGAQRMVLADGDGADGEAAVLLRIDSSRGTVFKNTGVTTVLNVTIYYGSQRITTGQQLRAVFGNTARLEWEWLRMDEDRYGVISASDTRLSDGGFVFALSPEDVDVKVTFRCSMIID